MTYLTNRTWVKEMELDLSKNRVKPSFQGFTTWKASLQSNGFFIQCISNSPYKAMLIFGESTIQFWQTSQSSNNQESLRGVAVASKNKEEGGSEDNSRQVMCQYYKQVIANVLNFGINGLDTKSIKWVSSNQFTSPLLDWIGQPTSGKIEVTIESFEKGLPNRLRYISTTKTNRLEFLILCRYDQPVLPPSQVVIQKLVNGKVEISLTNIIPYIIFGEREDAINGFVPTNFFTEELAVKHFIMESNGQRFIIQTNGNQQLIKETSYSDPKATSRANLFRFILVSLLIFPLIVFLYIQFRKKVNGET